MQFEFSFSRCSVVRVANSKLFHSLHEGEAVRSEHSVGLSLRGIGARRGSSRKPVCVCLVLLILLFISVRVDLEHPPGWIGPRARSSRPNSTHFGGPCLATVDPQKNPKQMTQPTVRWLQGWWWALKNTGPRVHKLQPYRLEMFYGGLCRNFLLHTKCAQPRAEICATVLEP